MALSKVTVAPSCMWRSCVRTPHSGCVRSRLRVAGPPFWTMPSPVPMSWSRKSLYGWMVLLPRAAAPAGQAPRRLEQRDLDEQPGDLAVALAGLGIGDGGQRVRVDRLDEAVAEHVGRHPQSADVFRAGYALLDRGIDRAIVDQRT